MGNVLIVKFDIEMVLVLRRPWFYIPSITAVELKVYTRRYILLEIIKSVLLSSFNGEFYVFQFMNYNSEVIAEHVEILGR